MERGAADRKRALWLGLLRLQTISGTLAVCFILAYLWPVLSFTREQTAFLGLIIIVLVSITMPPYTWMFYRWYQPIFAWLEAGESGDFSEARRLEAFSVIIDLPRRQFIGALALWCIFGFPASFYLHTYFDDFSQDSMVVLWAALLSGGLVSATLGFFLVKRQLEPLRTNLTDSLPDPTKRRAATRMVSVRQKLLVSTTGLVLVSLILGVSVANIRGKHSVEYVITTGQQEILGHLTDTIAQGTDPELAIDDARDLIRPLVPQILLLHPSDEDALSASPLTAAEVRAVLENPVGDSGALDTANAVSWRTLADGTGRMLVAIAPLELHVSGFLGSQFAFGALLAVALCAGVLVASFIAGDLSAALQTLRKEMTRIAGGDLRRDSSYEAEDELGEVARSMEEMTYSLRRTVSKVATAVSRVDTTTKAIESASSSVKEVAEIQNRSIEQVSAEIDQINSRSREIAGSAANLGESVDASSSAVLELTAASQHLRENATELTEQVHDTASSYHEMSASIEQVSQSTHQLAEAAEGAVQRTNTMASEAQRMEANASQSQSLQKQVVDAADRGADRVSETMDGMVKIRSSVGEARDVIHDLAQASAQIHSIVTVIDDVADQTSLLALNAAIIAAQAGEYGKPFAVVGDEIKSLAAEVQVRTSEIAKVVTNVTSEAARALRLIEDGSSSVDAGVELSTEAGRALEAITQAIGESSTRVDEIVLAVQTQATGAGQVAGLMDGLNEELLHIRQAGDHQTQESRRVEQSSLSMQDIASSVQKSSNEQANTANHISTNIEKVSLSTTQINHALDGQAQACAQVAGFLDGMLERNRRSEDAVSHLDITMRELRAEAESLREAMGHFEHSGEDQERAEPQDPA